MEGEIILIDTSILINYFRKSDKSNSKFISLYDQGYTLCVSVITEYEIYSGATDQQIPYWKQFLSKIKVFNFDSKAAIQAVRINNC